jgi:mannose-1-phosphate guanylyltransferase
VKAVVLVGGLGTRLRPLTETVPKPMLPILDRTMVEHLVARLATVGIDEVVLSLRYQPDAFQRAFPGAECGGVRLRYAVEPEPLDTGGGIAFAARSAGVDSTFLAVNGDVLNRFDLAPMLALHRRTGAEGTVATAVVDDPSDLGVVVADSHGRVTQWVEKPGAGRSPANTVNAGTYVLEPSVLDRIPEGTRLNINSDTFALLVADGTLFALPVEGWWLDVGTVPRYLQAHEDLLALDDLDGRVPLASSGVWVAPGARIDGEVAPRSFIGAGARIEAGATVEASSIGPGVVVASGAVVRRSVVLADAVVGEGATVDASVIGGRTRVAPGATVPAGSGVAFDAEVGA